MHTFKIHMMKKVWKKRILCNQALYMKGYSEDDDSLEPLEHLTLTSCRELVDAFEERERDRSLLRTIGLGLRHS